MKTHRRLSAGAGGRKPRKPRRASLVSLHPRPRHPVFCPPRPRRGWFRKGVPPCVTVPRGAWGVLEERVFLRSKGVRNPSVTAGDLEDPERSQESVIDSTGDDRGSSRNPCTPREWWARRPDLGLRSRILLGVGVRSTLTSI